jgi:hypothetical protein
MRCRFIRRDVPGTRRRSGAGPVRSGSWARSRDPAGSPRCRRRSGLRRPAAAARFPVPRLRFDHRLNYTPLCRQVSLTISRVLPCVVILRVARAASANGAQEHSAANHSLRPPHRRAAAQRQGKRAGEDSLLAGRVFASAATASSWFSLTVLGTRSGRSTLPLADITRTGAARWRRCRRS